MRKTPFTLTLILVLSMLLNVSSFAVYENGPQNIEYNRTNAQSYIGMYTTSPNSAYHYFTYPDEGGDCTNFASQVVRAGGMSMTAAVDNPGDSSWYYYGSSWGRGRSSSWTSATKFRTYWAVWEKRTHTNLEYTWHRILMMTILGMIFGHILSREILFSMLGQMTGQHTTLRLCIVLRMKTKSTKLAWDSTHQIVGKI